MGFEMHSDLFIDETIDLLKQVETPLMELELEPDRKDLVDTIFRAMHTIKGSAGMFGFDDISRFTHDIETTFDEIRKGVLAVTPAIIELTLQAKDCIRVLIDRNDSEAEQEKRRVILSELAILSGKKTAESAPMTKTEEAPVQERNPAGVNRIVSILFAPDKGILQRGVQLAPLLDELASLGDMAVSASTEDIPELDEFDPEINYLSWKIRLLTDRSDADIRSVFIFVEDYSKITIQPLSGAGSFNDEQSEAVASSAPMLTGTTAESSSLKPESVASERKTLVQPERRRVDSSSIRVKNQKLDQLVNYVGEMVTLHARLEQQSRKDRSPEFLLISESLGRLSADLRDITMSIRMVPLSDMFGSFTRLVHDLSKNLGKKMQLQVEGGETELDKNVIEELRDPIMHIIRNSADHGIEMPDVRAKSGKPETGTILLSAEHTGSNVRITISDDGSGLDREKIISSALRKGFSVSADADDRTVFSLVFEPGFSTAAETTDISGRGVGMDVVKRNIEKLRGSVDIKTESDKGTAISLTIPLTLAIIDGFMTEISGNYYIFNLASVRECITFDGSKKAESEEGMFRLRENYIPYIDLRRLFDIDGNNGDYPQIVIAEFEETIIGFLVDRVIGHFQTVIKPLGKGVNNAAMFSGASILGDGSIALILDINQIVTKSETAVRAKRHAHGADKSL